MKIKSNFFKRLPAFLFSLPGLILLIIMTVLDFSVLRAKSDALSQLTGGLPILDTRLWYTPADLQAFLSAAESLGRSAYQQMHALPDLFFPILYSLSLIVAIRIVARRLGLTAKTMHRLTIFGVLPGVFDLLENASLIRLTALHPTLPSWLAALAPVLTLLKWLLLAVVVLLLLGLLISLLLKRFSRQID